MDNQDNLLPLCPTNQLYNSANSLLNNLLEDALTDRDIFPSYPTVSLKQQALQEQEAEENQRFDLRTIEKQEFNRTFPEKLFAEMAEEDAFQMNMGFRKCLNESILLQKRSPQINKTAYLNESKQDKLARYRQKKARRIWQRKISYDCRKVVADKRERKNGRFIKKEEDKDKQTTKRNHEPQIQSTAKQQGLSFKVQQYYQ